MFAGEIAHHETAGGFLLSGEAVLRIQHASGYRQLREQNFLDGALVRGPVASQRAGRGDVIRIVARRETAGKERRRRQRVDRLVEAAVGRGIEREVALVHGTLDAELERFEGTCVGELLLRIGVPV